MSNRSGTAVLVRWHLAGDKRRMIRELVTLAARSALDFALPLQATESRPCGARLARPPRISRTQLQQRGKTVSGAFKRSGAGRIELMSWARVVKPSQLMR